MAEQDKPARVGRVVQQAAVIFAGAEITAVAWLEKLKKSYES